MKNILVAINFDENTSSLIDKASEFAEKFNSKIWIVHIFEPEPDFINYEADFQYINDNFEKELDQEYSKVQDYVKKTKAKGIDAEGIVIKGSTIDLIIDESKKLNIDLIIMGHHEHNFLYKIFLGNPLPGVIKKSKVPVLIIPF